MAKLLINRRFTWTSKTLGKLIVHNYTTSDYHQMDTKFPKLNSITPIEFARHLAHQQCEKDIGNSSNNSQSRISEEEAGRLTEEELEDFAKIFLRENEMSLAKIPVKESSNLSSVTLLKKMMISQRSAINKAFTTLSDEFKNLNLWSNDISQTLKNDPTIEAMFNQNRSMKELFGESFLSNEHRNGLESAFKDAKKAKLSMSDSLKEVEKSGGLESAFKNLKKAEHSMSDHFKKVHNTSVMSSLK